MNKTKTICFTNNKGGSGKSTTCSNIGAAMARAGKKVLMIDGDMQLNLSLAFFSEDWVLEQAAGDKNLYHAIREQKDLADYIVHTDYENLDLIPSSTLMSSIEYELFTKWQREFILKKCLQNIKDSGVYDYILVDAPPTLGPENAMDQYNRIADAILTLDTMAERIRIMESEPERSKEMRRLLVDNYSVFFVIQGDKVIVTDVLYSASDIESRLKG